MMKEITIINPQRMMKRRNYKYVLIVFFGIISLFAFQANAADRFWVGGTGVWNNPANWSATSGGAGGAGVPTGADRVIFDLAGTGTVTVNVAASCAIFDWTAAAGSLTIDNAQSLTVGGNMTMNRPFNAGNGTTTTLNGATNVFNNTVSFGTNTTATFNGTNTFNDDVTVAGTIGAAVTFNNATFKGANNQFFQRFNFTNNTTFDVNSVNTFAGGAFNKTFADVTVKQGATLDLQTTFPGVDQFANLNLESNTITRFNGQALGAPAASTVVTGKIVINTTTCALPTKYAILTSNNGNTTNINFGTDQEWNNVIEGLIQNVGIGNIKVKSAGAALPPALGIEDWASAGRVVYWVGGTSVAPQNWGDCRNWATSSGASIAGSAGVDPPINGLDTVIFDANSFTAGRNQVIMNVLGGASIMDWSGATNNPVWSGANTLIITRNITLISAMTITSTMNVLFNSSHFTPNNQITMAGQSFNGNIDFTGAGTGVWEILDNLSTNNVSRILVGSGTLNTNNNPITAGAFSANAVATTRTLNLGSSAITITGTTSTTGIVFDMTDISGTLFLNSGTSTVTFNNGNIGDIIIETGQISKTLPNFTFTGFLDKTIDINTNAGGRITFQDLTVSTDATPNIIMNINGKSAKTYNNITFANNVRANFDGIPNSAPGSNNIVVGTITTGSGQQLNFNNSYTFGGAFTINGTAGTGITFTGDTAGMNNIFNGATSVLGYNAKTTFTNEGTNDFNEDVTIGSRIIWSFNSCAACLSTVASGKRMIVVANCGDDVIINSAGQPTAGVARVNFVSGLTYNWQNTVAQNLNNSLGGTVSIILGGAASSGNTNISVVVGAARTLYWVGGSGNWNDQSKWSLASGVTTMPNSPQCPPRIIDDVIFDNGSIAGTGGFNVIIDADAEMRNITFDGTTDIPTLQGLSSRTMTIAGNFTMNNAGSVLQNSTIGSHYQGRVVFVNPNPPGVPPTIAMRGALTFKNIAFGSPIAPAGSAWNLDATNGALSVENKLEIVSGTLNTNDVAISCGQLDGNPKNLPSPTSNFPRTLNMGNSQITITGTGTASAPDNPAIDFRGTFMTFAVPGPMARFILPNAGNIIINTGTNAVTMPRMDFTATANGGTVAITTPNTTNRVTFRELTIDANRDNVNFSIAGTSPKTYSAGFNLGSGAGNDGIIINLDGTTSNALQNIFNGAVVLGRTGAAPGFLATINGANQINGTVTIGTTTGAGVVFTGTGNNAITGALSAAVGAVITYSNAGTNTFAGVTLNDNVIWTFSNGGVNNLTGTLVPNASCNAPATITAASATANVNATGAQSWDNVQVSNLNSTGANITILSLTLFASTGNFIFAPGTRSVYWVGGRADNTSAPVNNLWNNPNNWSLTDPTSGAYNATTSPGACIPAACSDNVFFNAGSFVGGTGAKLDVTININALCGNMDWTGATNNPRLTGNTAPNNLSICGNLTMINAMQADGTAGTYEGRVIFITPTTPAVTNTIFVAGKRFNNIDFNASNNTSNFLIRDTPTSPENTLYAVRTVSLIRGTLTLNNVTGTDATATPATADINCNAFTTNVGGTGDQTRQLVMGANSRMLIRGNNTVLDLQGNSANFTLTSDITSTIELNNNGNITVNTGTQSKTIPNLEFSTVSNGTITVQGSSTNRITFRNITVANGTAVGTRKTFNMQTNAPKTYGTILFGNNINSTWDGATGTIASLAGTGNIFTGTVTMGTSTRARFNNSNYFDQAVDIASTTTSGANGDVYFANNNTFNSTLTFSDVNGRGWASFGQNGTTNDFFGAVRFLGTGNNVVTVGNNTSLARFRNILLVNSDCGTAPNFQLSTGDFSSRMEFRDDVTWGNCAGGVATTPVFFRNFVDMFTNTPAGKLFLTGNDSRFTYAPYPANTNPPAVTAGGIGNFRNMRHGQNNLITYNNWVAFDNYFLTRYDIVLFPRNNNNLAGQPSIIRNRMDANVDCSSWIRIASNLPTEQTNLQFDQDHNNLAVSGVAPFKQFEFVLFQDIHKTAGGGEVRATPANVSDISNNTDYNAGTRAGINFQTIQTKRTYYWVRSSNQITGAINSTNGDWADDNLDNHWSSPDFPVQAGTPDNGSGFGGSGLGPSGCIPTPLDSVIFDNNSVLGGSAIVNIDKYSVYSRGQNWQNTLPITLQGQDVYTAHVYGTMTGSANTTNNFGGTYMFTGFDTQNGEIKDITMNTMRFFGPVVFNNEKDRWVVQDAINVDNGARGSVNINYGILDMGGRQNNPTPPTLNLEGDFIMTARVGSTGFDRNAQFISRNSTVTFDGKGGNNQAIQMDGGSTGTPTVGQMKSSGNCVECTEYRITAAAQADVVKMAGVYPTNPASNLYNAATDAQVISCSRSPFYNLVIDKTFGTTLNIQSTNGAIALSIYNDLRILNGRVQDNGNQIRGNFSNPLNPVDGNGIAANGGVLQMSHNTRLTLGNGGVATVFPTCFRTDNITLAPMPRNLVYTDPAQALPAPTPINNGVMGTIDISGINPAGYAGAAANTSPEVRYVATGSNVRQLIAGVVVRNLTNASSVNFPMLNVGPSNYGSLSLIGGNTAGSPTAAQIFASSKDLTGPTTIQGTLRIGSNSGRTYFRDMGKVISGNNFVNNTAPQTYNMIFIDRNSTLELGTGSVDLTYSAASAPAIVFTPPASTANFSTSFPNFTGTVTDFAVGAGGGKMSINSASTVIYNSGSNQPVLGGITYGNLTLRARGRTAGGAGVGDTLVNKTVTRDLSILTTIRLTVNGNLLVDVWNNLIDDGWQIQGSLNNPVTAAPNLLTGGFNSQLTLGINDVGTVFPTNYARANINLEGPVNPNLTVYNAGHLANGAVAPMQLMSTTPIYGDITLRDPTPVAGSTNLIEKRFSATGTVDIKGNLTVERHNHLNDAGLQISRQTVGGTMRMENGWITTAGLDSANITRLTLGSAVSATDFPRNFSIVQIEDNTTVIYNGTPTQRIAGNDAAISRVLNGAAPSSYFNLWAQSTNSTGTNGIKNLQGDILIRNDFVIRQNGRFNDANSDVAPTNAFQIVGSATGNMTMEANSELRLDKWARGAGTATLFPTNFVRNISATESGISLAPSSTVFYNANTAQEVSSRPMYGNVTFRRFSLATLVPKTVNTDRTDLDIRGNLRIEAYNSLIDNGRQIIGRTPAGAQPTTGLMFMANTAFLTLGTQGGTPIATAFPTGFLSANIDMDVFIDPVTKLTPRAKTDMNTVIYNADLPQTIAGAGIGGTVGPGRLNDPLVPYVFPLYYWNDLNNASAYGNIILTSSVPVTKTLGGTINMRGNLIIDNNNTLDADNTNNYRIYLGGDWFANTSGVFTARQGRVTFDGYNVNQDITTRASSFYDIGIDKTPNNNRTSTLLDQLTVTNQVFFKNGYFVAAVGREFIYATGATTNSVEFGTSKQYTTIDATIDAGTDGPSDNSHVLGPVTRIGVNPTRFFFPVGNGTFYAPIGINSGATTVQPFTARYYGYSPNVNTPPGPFPTNLIDAGCANNVSDAEFWTLDNPNAPATATQVTLSWAAARSGGVTFPSGLFVMHYTNIPPPFNWKCEGNDGTNTNSVAAGIIRSANFVTNFSPFTLGSITPVNPLPIQLVKFEAKADVEKQIVNLDWVTASETNNDFFTLEKSKDGKDFIAFKEVPSKAKGNSRTSLEYTEIDTEPMRGLSYYRLKQTDFDGKVSYSKIVPVYFEDGGEGEIVVYPNPTEGDLNMQIFEKGTIEGTIYVTDVLGKQIHSEQVNDLTSAKSHLIQFKQNLASGVYVLRFVGKNKSYIRTFVINK
jgi:hypothetical protein